MLRKVRLYSISAIVGGLAILAVAHAKEVVDLAEAQADTDFAIQGEYVAEGVFPEGSVGAQVIASGNGQFRVVVYKGGLPGDGWARGGERLAMEGPADGLKGEELTGKIADGKFVIADADGNTKIQLTRTERKSCTLGKKPPAGAVVIFDGSNLDMFQPAEGHLTDDKNILSGVTMNPVCDSYKLHLEFRLSWMPEARGQGRSNSGVYIHDCYECQVLDSFGLEGRNNECGGFYSVKEPDVNMCFPPMAWQTYDIDFTAPRYDGDRKVANARITILHNGVVIHKDVELPRATPGRQGEAPGARPIHLQGHGNKVYYRNIWIEKK